MTTATPSPTSTSRLLKNRASATPDRHAYTFPADLSAPTGAGWDSLTWSQVDDRASALAAGLISLGLQPTERVAIAATTSIRWALVDYGVMYAGGATVTVYPTTVAEDVDFILSDSGSRVLVVEDAAQFARLTPVLAELPQIHHVIVLYGDVPEDADADSVLSYADLLARGRDYYGAHPRVIDDRINALTPEHLATVIYTSGTTGRPKGVELPHRTWLYEIDAVVEAAAAGPDDIGRLTVDDLQYLWLPLAHVLGKLMLLIPVQVGFETAIDGRTSMITENLPVIRPTYMVSPPRVFEKAYGGVNTMMQSAGGVTGTLFTWASRVCSQIFDADHGGDATASPWLRAQAKTADRLVMAKVRQRFGGRIRYFISGAAALDPDIARWFGGAGMMILEGYGLTETCAASSLAMPWNYRPGYIGAPLPGTEARTDEAGEILLRGPGMMDGFHNNPDATAEMIDADGWLHTGDLGEIDDAGRIRLTGRKKELFKTSNGKYVAPTVIEAKFKGICPISSQMVVIGDNRNFTSALITLDEDAVTSWAQRNGVAGFYGRIVASPQMREVVQGYVDTLNEGLNQWEKIKKFTIMSRDLTVEDQEITPSLKLRRTVVTEHFADDIAALYA
ncbi:AMP-dependent synthetase/ligase [Corynebacterium terpenotabidum]|uniref:Acyl-CoA synthetase n=1 Tax=Corynebacterium terpenotabidum Y-11 TaxID=1200352 RepID=S4XBP1_9CORY|nr:long-chain fatty acid--CoA ligase [Corynebacterium terpenotabidum]AGP29884.1 acyl-CoA synthetase [Corynebacterium terpenotabidum Y-11]